MDYIVICEIYDGEPFWYLYEIKEKGKKKLIECFKSKEELFGFVKTNNIEFRQGKTKRFD